MSENDDKRQLREISRQHYFKTVEFLKREAKDSTPEKLLEYINSRSVKETTRYNYLNSIISLQKADPSLMTGDLTEIKKIRDELKISINKARSTNNLTDKQKAVMTKIKREDIEDLIASLATSNLVDDKHDYILLRLMYPDPMRNDLADLKIVKRKVDLGQYNAIYIPHRKTHKALIKIVDHKTSSAQNGKPLERELDLDLTQRIKDFLKIKRKDPMIYLFQDKNGKPYSSSAFCHKFERMFQKRLGVSFSSSTLRKIFWTGNYGGVVQEMREHAAKMGHDLQTVQKCYLANCEDLDQDRIDELMTSLG